MKITNNYNLPEAIYRAVSAYIRKPSQDKFSVTELISPPLMRKLKIQYWEMLEEDASERLWALLGQAIHAVLDKVNIEETLQEEKLQHTIDGVTISGRMDIYHGESKTIEDYKVTSVYSFLLGDKPEWEQQLNIYAYLLRKHGFEVEKLTIHAILRDWKQSEAQKNNDYPEIPFISIPLPVWQQSFAEQFIKKRIEAHRRGDVCTDEERWLRKEKWAIKKSGNKTALRLFASKDEAEHFMKCYSEQYKTKLELEHRAGQYIRCESFCPVRAICPERK